MALLLVPGPVVLYTVTRSIDQGRAGGIASTLGVGLGDFCHVLVTTLGLSALLLSMAAAFNVVKVVGALYLIYLGIRTLMRHEVEQETEVTAPTKRARIFSQGFLVSLLNPNTALFFTAFLPQFIDPPKGQIAGQILLLGTLFVVMGMCTNSVYVLLASTIGRWLRGNRSFLEGRRYFAGGIYILLGLLAALSGTSSS
jgi:threonine/homoserine/homoserine lactone efflux protein